MNFRSSPRRTRRTVRRDATAGSGRARTPDLIRSAAIELIYEHGFEAMHLRMLAGRVGIRTASLYNHIRSKQDLLFRLIKQTIEELVGPIERELASIEDPLDQMRAFVALFLGYNTRHKKQCFVFSMEVRSLTAPNYRVINKFIQQYHNTIRKIIGRGVTAGAFRVGDIDIAMFAIIQMLSGVIRWYDPKGRLTLEEMTRVYTDLTLGALGVMLTKRVSENSRSTGARGKRALLETRNRRGSEETA
jgi:AcrR family transcriptional regulator